MKSVINELENLIYICDQGRKSHTPPPPPPHTFIHLLCKLRTYSSLFCSLCYWVLSFFRHLLFDIYTLQPRTFSNNNCQPRTYCSLLKSSVYTIDKPTHTFVWSKGYFLHIFLGLFRRNSGINSLFVLILRLNKCYMNLNYLGLSLF